MNEQQKQVYRERQRLKAIRDFKLEVKDRLERQLRWVKTFSGKSEREVSAFERGLKVGAHVAISQYERNPW